MKISIDFDGTFWEHWAFFGEMGRGLQSQGHEVGILTGHDYRIEPEDRRLLISRCNFTPDFFLNRNDQELLMEVREWKAGVIERERIDVAFDDDAHTIQPFLKNGTFMIKTRSKSEPGKF